MGRFMIKLIKKWWPTIVGIIILNIPAMLEKDVYFVNVVCSVVATVFFSISICLDEKYKLKEELRLRNKERLEKIQSILFLSVLLLLTLIGYLFKIEGLILFYAYKNGFGIGIVPVLVSLLITGGFTIIYKLLVNKNRKI